MSIFRILLSGLLMGCFSLAAIAQDGEPGLIHMGFDAAQIKVNETTTLRIGFINNGLSGTVPAENIMVTIALPSNKVFVPQGGTAAVSGPGAAFFDWVYNSGEGENILIGTPNQPIGPGEGGEIQVAVVGMTETAQAIPITANIIILNASGMTDDPNTNLRNASLQVSGVLPVKLVSFEVKSEVRGTAQLSWATTEEVNTDHFEVQHSRNAKDWRVVETVASKGEGKALRNYAYTHAEPGSGINYYKLRIVDRDASYEYTDIRSIRLDATLSEDGVVYPNPASERFLVKGEAGSDLSEIQLYNGLGQLVRKVSKDLKSGVSLDGLPHGIYSVRLIRSTGESVSQKLIVGR